MEFLILGPLEVSDDGRKLALGGPKQRAVLAHLILRANRLVAADLLIDGLWGEEPPESARNTLWIVGAPIHDNSTPVVGGTTGVLLIRADGTQMFTIAAGGSEPSWRPDVR